MSQFLLSCTTCATRMPGNDEVEACFAIAPKIGFGAWGIAGPLTSRLGLAKWVNFELVRRRAEEVGLTRCTEVYSPTFPTSSIEDAQKAAPDIAALFDAAEVLGSPFGSDLRKQKGRRGYRGNHRGAGSAVAFSCRSARANRPRTPLSKADPVPRRLRRNFLADQVAPSRNYT